MKNSESGFVVETIGWVSTPSPAIAENNGHQ
jgi:hypothetical protein